jgi:2-polyprenyl-3-methyl-5-hydroxy-6-metoxy-1,4-benzoquinol methylase
MSKYSDNMPPNLKDAIGWMFDYIDSGKDKVFLDFGCSTGYFGSLIKQAKGIPVYGVEISDDAKEARKVLDGVYSFDLDADWPEQVYERTYDYLFFGDVIEHLKDPGKTLEKCKKLLKKDGRIFISTPNIAHISIRLELMGGNFDYEPMGILDNTHLKYFTRSSLQRLVHDAGYEVQRMDFTANDFSDKTITGMLDKLGLKPSDKFWKLMDAPEARAFQHKFIISLPTAKPLSQVEPLAQKPEAIRNAEMVDLVEKIQNLDNHAKEQAKVIDYLKDQAVQLEYRVKHPIKTAVKSRLKR